MMAHNLLLLLQLQGRLSLASEATCTGEKAQRLKEGSLRYKPGDLSLNPEHTQKWKKSLVLS